MNFFRWSCAAVMIALAAASNASEAGPWANLDAQPPRSPALLRADLAGVRAELADFEAEIASARAAGVDTGEADISDLTVRRFVVWIDWDIGHPAELLHAVGRDEVAEAKKIAAVLAPPIPGQEIADCRTVLDRAREALARARGEPAPSRPVSVLSSAPLVRQGSYFFQEGRPVFIGGMTWAPEDRAVHAAYGPIASIQITPASLTAGDGGLSADALRQIRRERGSAEAEGGRFDVFLGHSPPAWALREHPEITAGSRLFIKYDIDHPLVRAMWQRLLGQAVPVLAASPASLHTYMLANEPHWYTTKGTWSTGSVSEYTFAKFRIWLADRYRGNVAELNRRWGTSFGSFPSVRLDLPLDPARKGSAVWYDWCRFNMDRVDDWFAFLRGEIRKSDPQALCYIKLVTDFWLSPRHERDYGLDYETLAAQVEDVAGADTAAEPPHTLRRFQPIPEWAGRYAMGWQVQSMYYDFLKSVAPDKPIFDSEYHAFSAGSWCAPHLGADYVRAVLWLGHLHGLAVNQAWYWPRRADGGLDAHSEEGFYGSLGMSPVALDAYGRTMRELNAHASAIAALAAVPKPVRIFYSTDSAIQSSTFIAATNQAYEAAYFSGSPVGFVTERMLAAARPDEMKAYPLLIIPSATHVTDGAMEQIRRYAAGGGTVVLLGPAPLERNVYGDKRPDSELAFLAGAPRIDGSEAVETIGARLASLAERAGIRPLVSCRDLDGSLPWGVRCVGLDTGRGLLVHLINLSRDARTVVLKTNAGAVGTAKDLLSGATLHGPDLTLRPLEMRLLLIPNP